MARSAFLVFLLLLARSLSLVFSARMARSFSLVFSTVMARSFHMVSSLKLARLKTEYKIHSVAVQLATSVALPRQQSRQCSRIARRGVIALPPYPSTSLKTPN